ncbi:hypothetical protein, partial [Serratia marcescens]|uniref:hypothetical protein n=1 Tax=Serratia marcescens TaxID=615 RepID=UPI001952DFAF
APESSIALAMGSGMLDTCAFSSPIIPINNFAVGALLTSTGHCRIAMLLVSITTMVMELHLE